MATVCHPATGRVTASFAAVAKHYGVSVAICPPRRGQPQGRGGEGQPHRRATLVAHPGRRRHRRAGPGSLRPVLRAARRHPAAPRDRRRPARPPWPPSPRGEPLQPVPPAPFPAAASRARGSRQRAGAGRLPRQPLLGATRAGRAHRSPSSHRLGAPVIEIATSRGDRHRPPPARAAAGAGAIVRDHGHVTALEHAAHGRVHDRRAAPPQAAHPTRPGRPGRRRRPCRRHRPPTRRRRHRSIDLARYARRRPRKEHPAMTTTHRHRHDRRPPTDRSTPAQASLYQQLRGHLAALKLHTAAEAPARRPRPGRAPKDCR